ncbi:MAG: hypothetical protein D6765_05785 [Bacteroidetes bacterium]|nr:MAG: hypothetical protein D6765_05785 [Bacteroidota bacterium]
MAETYAYCLLKNHFHLLIRTRPADEIIRNVNVGRVPNPADVNAAAAALVSRKFSALFNSYAQAVNKTYGRTGGLFEEPFRRIPVNSLRYRRELVRYIHRNPQLHGFIADFRDYPHSSWNSLLAFAPTRLERETVLQWFGGRDAFLQFHLEKQTHPDLSKYVIEV